MSVKFIILGSGSSGNCVYLETAESRVLIDAGFNPRQIRQRLATIGRTPENLTAILLTHEHSDHISGLPGLADKLQIPIYCNRGTRDGAVWAFKTRWTAKKTLAVPGPDGVESYKNKMDWHLFETGSSFDLGDVQVDTFSIPHDAQDPVGFLIRTSAGNFGFATDLGHMTKLVIERTRPANVLVLESNHDVKLLQDCPYRPWSLKQRILGRHGHLSNEAAADAAEQIVSPGLTHLYLGHLSSQCNKPEIARRVMNERLLKIGATHVRLEIALQKLPAALLEF